MQKEKGQLRNHMDAWRKLKTQVKIDRDGESDGSYGMQEIELPSDYEEKKYNKKYQAKLKAKYGGKVEVMRDSNYMTTEKKKPKPK